MIFLPQFWLLYAAWLAVLRGSLDPSGQPTSTGATDRA